jgi:iron complex transport system substrate-binding protein
VDAELLSSLAPDLILTQDLCHVCAASPDDLATALTRFRRPPQVLSLTPRSLDEVWDDVRRVGEATGHQREAQALASALTRRVTEIAAIALHASSRPRVLCLEWLDPYFVGGHWVPQMVAQAGGEDVLGLSRQPSFKVSEAQIAQSGAELIVVMPCGYNAERAMAECQAVPFGESWRDLLAVRNRRVYAVDANAYFSRPGPRLADGVAVLAHLIHPELFPSFPAGSFHAV